MNTPSFWIECHRERHQHRAWKPSAMSYLAWATLLIASVGQAHAGIISTYDTRSSFDAAVGPTTLETFNSLTDITNVPVLGGLDVGAFTIERTVSFLAYINPTPSSPFDVDGTTNFQTNTYADHDLTLVFDAPMTAFGADFAGFNDDTDGLLRTRILVDGDVVEPPLTVGNAVRFFGFQADTSFTTLTFEGVLSDAFAMDNVAFTTASPVPEPSRLALLGMGGLTLLGYGWRTRSHSKGRFWQAAC